MRVHWVLHLHGKLDAKASGDVHREEACEDDHAVEFAGIHFLKVLKCVVRSLESTVLLCIGLYIGLFNGPIN